MIAVMVVIAVVTIRLLVPVVMFRTNVFMARLYMTAPQSARGHPETGHGRERSQAGMSPAEAPSNVRRRHMHPGTQRHPGTRALPCTGSPWLTTHGLPSPTNAVALGRQGA
jgi:hypothetical protein